MSKHPLTAESEWLTPQEAAAYLRVSPKVIYRLATTEPTFPAVKLTNLLRIRRSRLERWLDNHHPAGPKRIGKPVPGAGNSLELQVATEISS